MVEAFVAILLLQFLEISEGEIFEVSNIYIANAMPLKLLFLSKNINRKRFCDKVEINYTFDCRSVGAMKVTK